MRPIKVSVDLVHEYLGKVDKESLTCIELEEIERIVEKKTWVWHQSRNVRIARCEIAMPAEVMDYIQKADLRDEFLYTSRIGNKVFIHNQSLAIASKWECFCVRMLHKVACTRRTQIFDIYSLTQFSSYQ